MSRRIVMILLLCLIAHLMAIGQSAKKVNLPANSTIADYELGVVWVKLKRTHKEIFTGQGAGRVVAAIKAHQIKPLLNRQSRDKNLARVAPRKPQVDISLYAQITFDKTRPVEEFINELYATGYFERVEPVPVAQPFFSPNDPSITQQYYLDLVNAPEAWNITQGNPTMVIAIVDTGGDLDHPDLQANLYIDPAEPVDGVDNDNDGYVDNNRGWDFSGSDIALIGTPGFIGDNDPTITKGGLTAHGTMVAGCASASTNNGTGISSVGFNTKLLFTKHYADNQPGSNYSSNLYEGILYAATHGADIINCSWGGYNPNTIAQDIITYVTLDLGCLVVAAAGNSNLETPIYPASYQHVLSVASSDQNDVRSGFSNFGKTIDIVAPGNGIYTTTYNNAYKTDSGTSLSAPIVSGAAALVWANNPTFTSVQVAEQLRVSADETIYTKNPAYLNKLGRGRLDVWRALTLTSPSIRVSNQLWTKDDGTSPGPGDNARLYMDFTNYLQPSSSQLTATLSSTSPFITILKNEIDLGIIPTNTTIRNITTPFEVVLSAALPVDQKVEVLLTFTDGIYQDFQLISFVVPSYIDVNENNIITSITAAGRIGYGNTAEQTNGSGFIYNEESMLFEMGLIMGSSSSSIFNNVRGINNLYDQDFTPGEKIVKQTPGEKSYSEVFGSFRNAPELSTASLDIDYRSLVWKHDPYRNFIILEYKIRNVSTSPITGFYFGVFADWDIALNGAGDRASWDNDTRTGYVFPAMPMSLPRAGIQALSQNVHYYAIDNDPAISGNPFGIYDGYTDSEKFLSISSGLGKVEAGNASTGNDVSHVVAVGPHAINPGEEVIVAFALHSSNTTAGLLTSAKYADTVYNYTLKAPLPEVDSEVEICYGSSTTIGASGATTYKWYKDFTGGSEIFTGSQFQTGSLFSDTVFYVSNADQPYESLRKQTAVFVLPSSRITASGSVKLCQGETVTLSSDDADAYNWSNGANTKSIEVETEGEYTLLVTNNNIECPSGDSVTVTVDPAPSAAFTVSSEAPEPGENLSFFATGTGAASWLWDFGDGITSTIQNPVHSYQDPGEFEINLTVTSSEGCTAAEKKTLGIVTGVENLSDADLEIYPNPVTTKEMTLHVHQSMNYRELRLFTTHGELIITASLDAGQQSVDISALPNGIYILKIGNSSDITTRKVVISR